MDNNEKLKAIGSHLLYSPPDPRTKNYPLESTLEILPRKVDHEKYLPSIMDQGSCGWCVSFGIIGAMQTVLNYSNKLPEGGLSTTFSQSLCKEIDGIPNEQGTYISTGLKMMNNIGTIEEKNMSFDGTCKIHKISATQKINTPYKIKSYSKLYGLTEVKRALASGKLVVIGTIVTDNNWLDNDKYILLPDGLILGGHCTFIIGYNDDKQYEGFKGFLHGVNSWSEMFGAKGEYWMCYDYLDYKLDIGLKPFMEAWAIDMGDNLPITEPEENIIELDQSVALMNGRVMAPVRFVSEFNNATVQWIGGTEQRAVITRPDGVKATLQVGNNKVIIE